MSLTALAGGLTAAGLAVMLTGEWWQRTWVRVLGKTTAASGFVWGGWIAWQDRPSVLSSWILAGLICSMVGDVLLGIRGRRPFLAGIAAFLVAHGCFLVGLMSLDRSWAMTAVAALAAAGVGLFVDRRLAAHIPSGMLLAVRLYEATILLMVVAAISAQEASVWLPCGAVAFVISDIAVARQRFVQRSFTNKAWGLPVYFGAQWLLIMGVHGS